MGRSIMDAGLILRAAAETAEAADAAEAGIALDLGLFHPLHKGADSPDYRFKAVLHNITVGGDVAPTSVDFIFEVAAAVGFASGEVEVARARWNGGKTMEVTLSVAQIRALHANPNAIRVRMDLTGGTNPSVDYGCYLTKL